MLFRLSAKSTINWRDRLTITLLGGFPMSTNIILNTDSYKASHWLQYPPNTETVFSYIESRGGKYDRTVFFGLQMFLKEYLSKPITQEMIDEADVFFKAHGEPFNRADWEYILSEYDGYLPVRVRAVKEGTLVPTSNILVSVENTDPRLYWLTSYIETALLRAVWYPTTVATNSWSTKQTIRKYLEETADPEAMEGLKFKLHDFGARGVSSLESAGIGGASHLINFMGSDTISGALYAMKYYNTEEMVSFSVPAGEHSSITTWRKERETAAYKNMLKQFGGKYPIVSVVSDSYDIYNAVENIWGGELKEDVIQCGSMLVIRPDSGDPATVVSKIAMLLDSTFGSTVNTKGYKILNNVRILQGDGITEESIRDILATLRGYGFSSDNAVFGQGGALLQQVNRDTQKFAMKASAAFIDGEWVDVFKDPITDSGKRSKKGRITLYRESDGNMFTGRIDDAKGAKDLMRTVYFNGRITQEYTFEEVREQVEATT